MSHLLKGRIAGELPPLRAKHIKLCANPACQRYILTRTHRAWCGKCWVARATHLKTGRPWPIARIARDRRQVHGTQTRSTSHGLVARSLLGDQVIK